MQGPLLISLLQSYSALVIFNMQTNLLSDMTGLVWSIKRNISACPLQWETTAVWHLSQRHWWLNSWLRSLKDKKNIQVMFKIKKALHLQNNLPRSTSKCGILICPGMRNVIESFPHCTKGPRRRSFFL